MGLSCSIRCSDSTGRRSWWCDVGSAPNLQPLRVHLGGHRLRPGARLHQGYPKKLGSIYQTRPHPYGLAPGCRGAVRGLPGRGRPPARRGAHHADRTRRTQRLRQRAPDGPPPVCHAIDRPGDSAWTRSSQPARRPSRAARPGGPHRRLRPVESPTEELHLMTPGVHRRLLPAGRPRVERWNRDPLCGCRTNDCSGERDDLRRRHTSPPSSTSKASGWIPALIDGRRVGPGRSSTSRRSTGRTGEIARGTRGDVQAVARRGGRSRNGRRGRLGIGRPWNAWRTVSTPGPRNWPGWRPATTGRCCGPIGAA